MSFDPPDSLRYETRDHKAYLTLNRPQRMNAFDLELGRAIGEAIQEFDQDDDLLVAMITGEGGRAFSAGADIKEMTEYVGSDKDPRRSGAQSGGPNMGAVATCRKPVLAAIDGFALAGGCELALMCDFRLATRQSSFGIPEVKRSLIAGPGTTHLPRMIPTGEALLMALTGDRIDAERAYQLGLVQRLLDDRAQLFEEADRIMDSICANPPLAVRDIKRVIKVGVNMPVEYAVYFREKYFDTILKTEDAVEGAAAFAEKRAPVWKMR
jgi:enoyl-CoA hydratase/carnithine racemase